MEKPYNIPFRDIEGVFSTKTSLIYPITGTIPSVIKHQGGKIFDVVGHQLLRWRRFLLVTFAAVLVITEIIEHPDFITHPNIFFFIEVGNFLFLIMITGIFMEVLVQSVESKKLALSILDVRHKLSLQLTAAQDWEETVSLVLQYPTSIMPVSATSLLRYDPELEKYMIVRSWITPNVEFNPALLSTAVDLGTAGPDNDFGYGQPDALAAYNWLAAGNRVTPTPTPVPTSTSTPTPTATATPSPTPTSPATTMHIGDLDGSSTVTSKSWNATVTILVHDSNEKPVSGATVSGKWTNGASGSTSCTTNTNGICQVSKTGLKTSTTSVTFSVSSVSYASLTYQPSANHDPDQDSNGTTIKIAK